MYLDTIYTNYAHDCQIYYTLLIICTCATIIVNSYTLNTLQCPHLIHIKYLLVLKQFTAVQYTFQYTLLHVYLTIVTTHTIIVIGIIYITTYYSYAILTYSMLIIVFNVSRHYFL